MKINARRWTCTLSAIGGTGGGIAVIIIVYTFMIRETGRQILYVKIIASRRCGRNRVCYVIMDGTGMMDMKDA